MKTLVLALGALGAVALARPAVAQPLTAFGGPPVWYPPPYVVPAPPFGYPAYPYYPYPLPPAPSLGFGRGGIYGHEFVPRDETITGYTFPGRYSR